MDRSRILRIVDANLNRAREALRTLEEVFRLGRDDADLASRVKRLRHGLGDYEGALGLRPGELVASRDPAGDVGRVATARPYKGLEDMVAANARRLEEALRVLEEYGRILGAGSDAASRARFEAYELEKSALPGFHARSRLAEAVLYFVLNGARGETVPETLAEAALRGGADIVQIRAFPGTDRDFIGLSRRLRRMCRDHGALFVVNDRPDIALACDADGVHVGGEDIPVLEARKVVGWSRLVGFSTHSIEEVEAVEGVDTIGIGAVFSTPVKPDRKPMGPETASALFSKSHVPAFPIGGIDPLNVGELTRRGVYRAAVSSAIADAPDPEAVARALKTALLRAAQGTQRMDAWPAPLSANGRKCSDRLP